MRRRSHHPLAVLALASTLLLTGCGGTVSSTNGDDVESVVGRWSSDEKGEPHLNFTEDGKVGGSDGCNGIGTTYEQDGSTVTLTRFATTLKACMGVDTWLREARHLEIDGETMTVMNGDHEEIGTLTRD
ncbi:MULTISPECIES: META domain-containing protein [Brevibacterium]|uniref:META domain-containing protein n=1 Tax=Brevibacterium TaxID=1696 RepID=UPI0010C7C9E2|nr:META domain-containing protein [Brevibacterium sp. CS2]QCP04923.1 META domain-containing protein [Brevibacterium sp. CS2]